MTSHVITLTTRDGQQLNFTCGPEQNLLAAAAEEGIILPSLCRDGGCGACLCTRVDGDYDLDSYNPLALPPDAAARGDVLLCRTRPLSNLSLKAPYDFQRIRFEGLASRPAEIVELETIAEKTVRLLLRLQPDSNGSQAADFEPGQYMSLEIPGTDISRAYSIANTPNWTGELEFLIRLQPGGAFSTYLEREAKIGQRINIRGPSGHFVLQAQSLRPRYFVGGGTGLAPLLSMLRHMAELQEPQPARLYFGVNREAELFCLNPLRELSQHLPQLKVELCVWHPEPTWSGFRGTPVDALRRDLEQGGPAPDLYLCGPPALIDAATETARAFGISDEHIFSERFLPST
ncbi:aromatic/alkene monooxygenase hydroxylase FAD-binding subunit MmoC [Methylocaldum szegediense]|uniref:Methane monooxygenase component C n=1 Tax=Methylocaldum szegediense TaxID=73780 RepID=A0ABN8X988_9GAMM|nr:FAD-binding oxidoreductase [Methylocaldum szegediense]CAI8954868.1 Methane monooxygenase component C [Methylocaldum szegediense]